MPSRIFKRISTANTNLAVVHAAPCILHGIYAPNVSTNHRYLKLYDLARIPVLATDVPVVTFACYKNGSGKGADWITIPLGLLLVNGLAMALTGAITDADETACVANEVCVQIIYEVL